MRDEIVVEWIYEWDKGTPIHRRVQTHLNESRKGNFYFELGSDPYVITDLKNGAPVLGRKNGRWTTVGRVLRRGRKVFLGKRDEPSLDETDRVKAALKWARVTGPNAAGLLGICRASLDRRLRDLGIDDG